MKRRFAAGILGLAVALVVACSKDDGPPGICAELSGRPCTCLDGSPSSYDCSAVCVCGDLCVGREGSSCSCGSSSGVVSCDGSCACLPTDMAPADDATASDQGALDLATVDAGTDMSAEADRVSIPAGTFSMGCSGVACTPDETPARDVTLSAYWIDRTEVSQSAFQGCIDAGACTAPSASFDPSATGDYPVVSLTFAQAEAYCAWAGGRIPTEAEWERACTGGDAREFPWGDDAATCMLANTIGCGPAGANAVLPVDSTPGGAAPEGAVNLAGNVWEWTADWYAEDAYANGAASDPTGPATGTVRVYRGGSSGNGADLARCRNRASTYSPDVGGTGLGFRCAY